MSSKQKSKSSFNHPAPKALDLLLTRRSGSAKAMTAPGPNKKQLADILQAGARAPDHGKLFPWRFIIFEGEGRMRAGDVLAQVLKAEGERDKHVADERERFLRAPLVIAVVSCVQEIHKVPVWEQELSAGAVCQNILIAATALGYVGNWLTEWYAYNPDVKHGLGLKSGERVAGFIYIGTPKDELEERPRPDIDKIVTRF